jgi:hypothetical protein
MRYFKRRSTVAMVVFLIIGLPSHTIIFAAMRSLSALERLVKEHLVSGSTFSGILNFEWDVRPPFNNTAAMPLGALHSTMSPLARK